MGEKHLSCFLYVAIMQTSLQAIASDSSNTEGSSTLGSVDDFSNDDYSKVKGPEKEGISDVFEGCLP